MLNHIRRTRVGRGIAVALSLAPFAVPVAALGAPAHSAAASKKCSTKPADVSGKVSRKLSKLTVTNTTCADGVKVVKAWGVRGKLSASHKYTPAPCIKGNFVKVKGKFQQIDTCTVLKYKCVARWKYANPKDVNHKLISYSTTCSKGKSKAEFTALVTRASR